MRNRVIEQPKYVNVVALKDALMEAGALSPVGIGIIDRFPAADVAEVKRGEWKKVKYNAHCSCGRSYGTYHFECSACGRIAYAQPYGLNFCPNCGAKMKG